jgi:site-specific DNA-methyltransferase (adenine-specific)
MFSFAGDTVLDPFAGSGSTAAAAIRAGRNSISIEIEPEYVTMAAARARGEAFLAAERGVQACTARISVQM